jgi:hypothetical protein
MEKQEQVEVWRVPKGTALAALAATGTGLEYAGMCLAEHEQALGRVTLKNRVWAERMERDLQQMREACSLLRQAALANAGAALVAGERNPSPAA